MFAGTLQELPADPEPDALGEDPADPDADALTEPALAELAEPLPAELAELDEPAPADGDDALAEPPPEAGAEVPPDDAAPALLPQAAVTSRAAPVRAASAIRMVRCAVIPLLLGVSMLPVDGTGGWCCRGRWITPIRTTLGRPGGAPAVPAAVAGRRPGRGPSRPAPR
jgi:hypothetical protein